MKKIFLRLILVITCYSYGQIPSYYNDVNISLTGQALQNELSVKIINTHTTFLSYTPGVWDALKQTDVLIGNPSKVILLYGYNDNDGDSTTDRTRGVNDNGGGSTDWNREHVYPKSLGNPNLGTIGPGADAHHLRPTDVQRNSSRGSRKFADGSGNSGITSQGHWYPGDEFKGDVARMMMYMYLRYGNRCLPSNVGVGSSASSDTNMLLLFLEWNAEDPVSDLELQRNPLLQNIQGNRNPFIDNPAFATQIWGGPQAEDRFGNGGGNNLCNTTISGFPYNESFESNFGDWIQSTASDDFNWIRRSGGTPSNNTGPSTAAAGSNYIYMESSSPNYSNKSAILYGPCFDLSNASEATFSFKYHMYGASNMGSLAVEASLDGSAWTSVWSRSGNQGNSWRIASVDLTNYIGNNIQLRFNGVTGTTWQGDMAVDDIELSTGDGSDGGDTEDISLRITFDNYPEETSWEIRDANNQIVFSGGTYGSQTDGSTITISRTLDQGCYTLIFKDAYGDGICCSYGTGSYLLTDSNGISLASGGSFGSQESKSFCIGSRTSTDDTMVTKPISSALQSVRRMKVFPNPFSDKLQLQTSKSVVQSMDYTIVNRIGQLVKKGSVSNQTNEIDLTDLSTGVYLISVIWDGNIFTEKIIKE